MKLKIISTLVFITTLPLIIITYKSIERYSSAGINCSMNFSATVSNDNLFEMGGMRKIFFLNDDKLQISSLINISKNGVKYTYERELQYDIVDFDGNSGMMRLHLVEQTVHAGDNTPNDLVQHLFMSAMNHERTQYIKIKIIDKKYIWFGDMYSDTGLCLINSI